MNGLVYTLHLLEPVLANSLAGDANSAQSLPYIPGGLVRGAIIAAYLDGKQGNAGEDEFRRLFLNGETRYLHAYPVIDGQRGLPPSLAWKAEKDETSGSYVKDVTIYNLAQSVPIDMDLRPPTIKTARLPQETLLSQEVLLELNVHTQRDAVYGRARQGAGAVYRYEALPAGLLLQGVILTASAEDAALMMNLVRDREILLGKARTAGYGHARFEQVEKIKPDFREAWTWTQPAADDDGDDGESDLPAPDTVQTFFLTFLSDAIVRDEYGQTTLDPLPNLSKLLGCELKARSVFRRSQVVGGFNRSWGMPLPQIAAIAAGSTFKLFAASPVSRDALHDLEERGLGERRAEGLGRLRIDLEQPATLVWRKCDPAGALAASPAQDMALSGTNLELGKLMLSRLLRRSLDEHLLAAIHDRPITGNVPNSQLSRWRVILRNALGAESLSDELERIQAFYKKESDKRSRAWQKMERARIRGFKREQERTEPRNFRLTEWIDEILKDEAEPWRHLAFDPQKSAPRLGKLTCELDTALTIEYRLRLIEAALADLGRRSTKRSNK